MPPPSHFEKASKRRGMRSMLRSGILFLGILLPAMVCGGEVGGFPNLPSIYTHYAADFAGNLTRSPLEQPFQPQEVDRETDRLMLPDLGFRARTYPKGLGYGVPVSFTTTGTLPPPLTPDSAYYLIPNPIGGYHVYSAATDADAAVLPGSVPGEKILPAQMAEQEVGKVDFSGGGTGTHTVHVRALINQLTDMTGNGFQSLSRNPDDRHFLLEIARDDQNRPFVRTAGALSRENWVGSYSGYGPTFYQSPSDKRHAARKQVGQKRVVYQIFVCRVRSFQERQIVKFMVTPEKISSVTDQIPYASDHRMRRRIKTGDLIQGKAYANGRLPSPLREGTDYYARSLDAENLTLHVSPEDAAGTGPPIDLTDSGEGPLLFWAPERVGDARRWSFFAEVLAPDSGGNTLSVRLQDAIPHGGGILKNATAFTVEGPRNGNVAGLSAVAELSPISFWTPPRGKLPPPLEAGTTYWVTRAPGSRSTSRLHPSLAQARKSLGQTGDPADTISFTAPGTGESLASYSDNSSAIAFGSLPKQVVPFATRLPLDTLNVLVFKIDFDDPEQASIFATLGINEVVTEGMPLDFPKGKTPMAIDEGFPAWTLFNSAQGHVPIDMDLYEMVFASSTEAVPDEEIQKAVDFLKEKYGIGSRPTSPQLPSNVRH